MPTTPQPDSGQTGTWGALARSLGFTTRSLRDWRKLPGAPTEPDLAAWQAFIDANDLGTAGNRVGAGREELLKEKLRKEIELAGIKIDKERRRSIPRSEVDALLLHIATRQKTLLYQRLETELPPKLDGLSAAETRPILRKVADDICDEMRDLTAQFEAQ